MAGLAPFEQVVERHGLDVWRFAVSQVGAERAEDVAQETMLAALAAYPTLRDPSAVRPWLLRIAARKAVDLFRVAGRTPVPVEELPSGSIAEADRTDDELWRRVRGLPDKQRRAVALRFVLDLDYAEIARTMETTPEAARRSVYEGLKRLRTQLDEGGCR